MPVASKMAPVHKFRGNTSRIHECLFFLRSNQTKTYASCYLLSMTAWIDASQTAINTGTLKLI